MMQNTSIRKSTDSLCDHDLIVHHITVCKQHFIKILGCWHRDAGDQQIPPQNIQYIIRVCMRIRVNMCNHCKFYSVA